jgi:hypothetical protein
VSRTRSLLLIVLACLVAGAAGWASRAELDEVITDAGRLRVALVPTWYVFAGFTALAALGAIGLAVAVTRAAGRTATPVRRVATLLLPLFGAAVLVVPYLPVVPDAMPAVQALAGPGRWLVWAAILGQLLWVIAPLTPRLGAWWLARSLRLQTSVVWIVTAAAMTAGAARLTHTVLFPSGDEPHYLILAQSLWLDHDLKIENNHTRGDYQAYFGRELDPHYLTRGKDREIYSVHPIGMPVLITPVMAAGGYDAVLAFFIAMAATGATIAWRWTVGLTGALGTTTLAWIAIAFSAPLLINAFTIYPEIPAALVVMAAVALVIRPEPDRTRWGTWTVGVLAATLPWLSTKYAPMSAAIVAVAALRRWWPALPGQPRRGWIEGALPLAVPYGVSLLAWFAFFQAYWGTPWPQAPYGRMSQTAVANTIFGVPGLLFDQEYGLLFYAPAYLIAGAGLWTMGRRDGPMRRVAVELALISGSLLMTVGAFRIWWGGSAAPGRPIVSGLLPLMLPLAVGLGSASANSARRAAQHLLVWTGVALTLVLVVVQDGLLLANDRDGTSSLLEWLSPRWPLWTLLPSFIAEEAPGALAGVAVWAVAILAGRWLIDRLRAPARGVASLAAIAGTTLVVALGAAGMRAMPVVSDERRVPDLRARSRLAALDGFDRVTRPLAVRYAPFSVTTAAAVEPTLAVNVVPGLRQGPQPVRVLHNGRWSLPAGRYAAVVRWAERNPLPSAQTTIGLQVGRIGPPLVEWTVDPAPGGTWRQEFWLPVDAGFVGLRGTPELERSIAEIRVEALDVLDAGVRTRTPQVLAAAMYGEAIVLFHDENMYPEQKGFWTTGQRQARITIACPGGCTHGVRLLVHSGKRPNRLLLESHGWSHQVNLTGETPVTIDVPPPPEGGVIVLETNTTGGFIPMDVDPTIRDRRYLGAWIEVHPAGTETH